MHVSCTFLTHVLFLYNARVNLFDDAHELSFFIARVMSFYNARVLSFYIGMCDVLL